MVTSVIPTIPDIVQVQVAFGQGHLDPASIPENAWTDITYRVQTISTKNGTNQELQQPDTGTCDLTVWNGPLQLPSGLEEGGIYTLFNSASPYYLSMANGKVVGTPLRVIVGMDGSTGFTQGIFFGYIDSWVPNIEMDQDKWNYISITASDVLKNANLAYFPAQSWQGIDLYNMQPFCWYRFDETATASVQTSVALDSSGNNRNGSYNQLQIMQLSSPSGVDPSPDFQTCASSFTFNSGINTPAASGQPFTFGMALTPSSQYVPINPMAIMATKGTDGSGWALCLTHGIFDSLSFTHFNTDGTSQILAMGNSSTLQWDKTSYVWLVYDGDNVALWVNGVERATASFGTITSKPAAVMIGQNSPSWGGPYDPFDGAFGDLVFLDRAVTGAEIGEHFADFTGLPQVTGYWINKVLNNAGMKGNAVQGIAPNNRNIDPGYTYIIAPDPQTSDVKSMFQQYANDEGGIVFVDGSGNVTFLDRRSQMNQPVVFTLGTDPGDVPFDSAEPSWDDSLVYTDVHAQRTGGAEQIASNPSGVDQYGQLSYRETTTLDHANDFETLGYAQWVLYLHENPQARIPALVVQPGFWGPESWATVLQRSIGDVGEVKALMVDGSGATFDTVVRLTGIQYDMDLTVSSFKATFEAVPADVTAYWDPSSETNWDPDTYILAY